MQGIVSFHPVNPEFFNEIIGTLIAGKKVNPDEFIALALKLGHTAWPPRRYARALALLLEEAKPPPAPEHSTRWIKVRTWMEKFDFRADPLAVLATHKVEPELHLVGRPFLITETSPEKVAETVDRFMEERSENAVEKLVLSQLALLDAKLGEEVQPDHAGQPPPDAQYRADLLGDMKRIHALAVASRSDDMWQEEAGDARRTAREVLAEELPWLAAYLHSRALPFWVAENMDGLATMCRAAGLECPEFLAPASMLFLGCSDDFPEVHETLGLHLLGPRSLGAYVPPDDIPELLDFLTRKGARIIQAAAREGEGTACATLLKKIRECATFARHRELGYLEASGIDTMHTDWIEGPDPLWQHASA